MEIDIVGRHVEVTEPMKRHIQQHIDRLPRFTEWVQYLTVTLEMSSGNLVAELIAKCPRADLVAQAEGHDMYQTVDAAFAKMERRLARHHDKLISGRSREAQQTSEDERRPE